MLKQTKKEVLHNIKLVRLIKGRGQASLHAIELKRLQQGLPPFPPRLLTIVNKNNNFEIKKEPIRFLRQEIIREGNASS